MSENEPNAKSVDAEAEDGETTQVATATVAEVLAVIL